MKWTQWALIVPVCGLFSLAACVDKKEDAPEPVAADYGDAPDGRFQADGTFDSDGYPTLFEANGARVLDGSAVALADSPTGGTVSLELDADDVTDPDGEPNFHRFGAPVPDTENRDDFDNGIISTTLDISTPSDPLLRITVGALLKDSARAGIYYLNVLFDHNVDGAWNGAAGFTDEDPAQQSTSVDLNDEWIVKNIEVDLSDGTTMRELAFDVPLAGAIYSATRLNGALPYMRLALTSEPIEASSWTGEGEFEAGEIEDWLIAGVEDPPILDCGGPGVPLFDFNNNNPMALPCSVVRPLYASDATAINFAYTFSPKVAPAAVRFTPTLTNPVLASSGQATVAAPLNLGVSAAPQANLRGIVRRFDLEVETDLNGATFVKRGFDSSVIVELSTVTRAIDFTDTSTSMPLTVCIGVSGSHNNPYGGQILQLTHEKDDCSMFPNDGKTDGTFIISGGEGFRGEGDMFLSILGDDGVYMGSGSVLSATYDGVALSPTLGWVVPVDQDSTGILDVSFSSGLSFQVRIDITFNVSGLNTVTQTVIGGTCEEV